MSPLERSLVERKLAQVAERLVYLERVSTDGWPAYAASFERRKATEKLLQELIEGAIDLNSHLLVELGGVAPRDYHDSFVGLGRRGWLPASLAEALAPSAGLRNRLVHQYAAIDDRRVFEALGSALELYPRYIAALRELLEREA